LTVIYRIDLLGCSRLEQVAGRMFLESCKLPDFLVGGEKATDPSGNALAPFTAAGIHSIM